MSERLALALEACPALPERRAGRRAGVAIEAEHVVDGSPAAVYAFLAELANHGVLTGRHLHLREVSPSGRGGRIVIAGPLGVRRTALTEVTTARAPSRFGGIAAVGSRTCARVDWTIEPAAGGGSCVALRAVVLRAGPLDRALLAVGGRAWLRRRFRETLERLDSALAGT